MIEVIAKLRGRMVGPSVVSIGTVEEIRQHPQGRAEQAMKDPEIQAILQDPMVRDVINNLSGGDQAAGQRAMSDPVMKLKIEKLIASGVLQTK